MAQYFYIASTKKLRTEVVGSKLISPAQSNIFKDEIDATGLFFEANYDAEIRKRVNYALVCHLSIKSLLVITYYL
ncbi:hypothetical protein [Virgibacillus chiguensis]|uniref:Uncharacterized protein n=1 Tax=Virgibacillus chiguensis TaxID=411959 RepID=A0A1M5WLR9_9BACI|nr:hypothetical protein [Virgibacillus chiguensis]SHH88114.1 hypothetical protein SAMN05421807_11712 [Virgibacillus chiguensis]